MATLRYKKRGNKWYVYEVHQYWDKELKKPRQKSKYLGVAEENKGSYSKPGYRTKTIEEKEIVDCGDTLVISEIIKKLEMRAILLKSFKRVDDIIALLCFQISEGAAMHNCIDWYEGNIVKHLFPNTKLTSQDISRLINHLGKSKLQHKFFATYIKKYFPSNRGILIDSTSLSSSINSSINAFGYSSGNIEQNISCMMLVDQKSGLPIYFRAIGGDIPDVSTLKTTIEEINHFGLTTDYALLDAGFCSKVNLSLLCNAGIDFITRLPKNYKIFNELVKKATKIEYTRNAVKYGNRIVFIKIYKNIIYENELFAYVILDPSKRSKDILTILQNQTANSLSTDKKTALDKKIKTAGFFILLSKNKIDKDKVLAQYYNRQVIEQLFSFAKSNNNLLPLRVHSEQSIKGYLMLAFLALIVFVTIKHNLPIPIEKAMINLRSFKAKILQNRIIFQEPNKKVKDIFKALNIIMPTNLGI